MRFRPFLACLASCLLLCSSVAMAQQATTPAAPAASKFDQLVTGKKKQNADGAAMWTTYHSDQQLLVEIPKSSLGKEYIILTSIARGISNGMVIGGMSWGFGDDIIWTFKQSGDKLFVIHRNVRYRAKAGSPEATAVEFAYSDSVIYALPILTTSPTGGLLVDMTRVFMSDDAGIGNAIGPGFRFMSDRSTWASVKPYAKNLELQVAAVYAGGGEIQTVPDTRGVQVNIHYSISELPKVGTNGFKPRPADDRVGYFLTAIKDFSDQTNDEHFVRYINRWNLEKLDPTADLSPPKEPIIFIIEKTVPVALRPTIEAGILEWNRAYEKIGFAGAIRVEQEETIEAKYGQEIDPEDVRYNFFRWITADAGFAMGPSRVDPRTGEILDADIIFDAGFLDSWKQDFELFVDEDIAALHPNADAYQVDNKRFGEPSSYLGRNPGADHASCLYCRQMQQQMGYATAVFAAQGELAADGKLPKEFIHQGLKEVVMHEVGHTLGLRHNFRASAWKTLDEINELGKGKAEGTVASVMDYAPANIMQDKTKQGLYYTQTVGPYDFWAIEYGYRPVTGDLAAELKKIASRSGEPGLDYSTDEDTRSLDSDPLSNRFDLGKDPIAFTRRQMEHASALLPKVVESTVKEGDGYQRARQAFGMLMSEYWRSAIFTARFPGGVYVHRDHKGDKGARPPFEIVEAAKQREAMALLTESVFSSPKIDGEMLNYLAASRWSHWGQRDMTRLDYPIHDVTLRMQGLIMGQLLSPLTLERLQDSEYKVKADEDAYTLAEHLRLISDGVFTEWNGRGKKGEFTDRTPYIDSFRRNLQRMTLRALAGVVTSGGGPEDAQTLVRMHLTRLNDEITATLKAKDLKLDDYSKAHLKDSQVRIEQALNATVIVPAALPRR
ncbi:MAG: zinc-dependent metalloprotease [Planctomycetaceae bacterium]